MPFLCNSLVLFMAINAAFCCSPQQAVNMVNALINPCSSASGVSLEYARRPISCGSSVHYYELFGEPRFHFSAAEDHKRYTLLLFTGDFPGTDLGNLRFFLNWAVTGIPGYELKNVHSGPFPPTPIVYLNPHALFGTFHYKFVVLEEVNGRPSLDPSMPRHNFDLRQFLAQNGMCSSAVAMYEIAVDA